MKFFPANFKASLMGMPSSRAIGRAVIRWIAWPKKPHTTKTYAPPRSAAQKPPGCPACPPPRNVLLTKAWNSVWM